VNDGVRTAGSRKDGGQSDGFFLAEPSGRCRRPAQGSARDMIASTVACVSAMSSTTSLPPAQKTDVGDFACMAQRMMSM